MKSRADILKLWILLLFGVFVFSSGSCQEVVYGVGNDRTFEGQQIGGIYYNNTTKVFDEQNANYVVHSVGDFLDAIEQAKNGEIIYLPANLKLDMTGHENLKLNAGIRLIGGKTTKDNGPVIYTTQGQEAPLFVIRENGVLVSGIRFFGPTLYDEGETKRFSKEQMKVYEARSKESGVPLETYRKMYAAKPMQCILAQSVDNKFEFEVNNCEFKGWSNSGITVGKNAKGLLRFNCIHDNTHFGLGYGIKISYGEAVIQGNYFNNNRHSIAGTGVAGSGYEASYNIVGPLGVAHAFDMHGGKDRGDGTDIAGDYVLIHNNEFQIGNNAIVIRGVPRKSAQVYHNVFNSNIEDMEEHFVQQWYSDGKVKVFDNKFVKEKTEVIRAESKAMPRKLIIVN